MRSRSKSLILGGVGLCAGILIDLSINARLKKLANAQSRGDKDDPKLTKNQVVKILREIAVADFPILIDLSQIASPVRRAAEWSHLESTVEALTAVSHRAVAKAESAENDVLKKYELQKSAFVKYALKLAETDDEILILINELSQMVVDASNGKLPILPEYKLDPKINGMELMDVMSTIHRAQRVAAKSFLQKQIDREGMERALTWLPTGACDEFWVAPTEEMRLGLRQVMKEAETSVLQAAVRKVGSWCNYMQAVSLASRDMETASQIQVLSQLHVSQLMDDLSSLRALTTSASNVEDTPMPSAKGVERSISSSEASAHSNLPNPGSGLASGLGSSGQAGSNEVPIGSTRMATDPYETQSHKRRLVADTSI